MKHSEKSTNFFPNPEYNNPNNYIEKQVVIGEGTFSLPGVLTVPKGEGPFPVVVLVHGSGPNDMDSTAYVFKPFRDMAVGLANEGIAVLRYDKRTNTHPIKSSLTPNFSIQEETVLDANLAVEKLKTIPEVDPDNIFVLGHSQGAYALPLILENDKNGDIKGGIGVAGLAGTFQDLLLWQLEQQVKRAEDRNAPAEQIELLKQQLAAYQQQYEMITNPEITTENLPAELASLYWWIDIRDYNPIDLAKKQDIPLLLLHGAKDLQVPVSHFEEWKTALKDRDHVQFKLYPDMFHMLANVTGEPNLVTEYSTPANVPQEFLSDISQWVKTGKLVTETKDKLKEYKDYQDNQYWSEAFAWAVDEGIIKGYENEKLLKPYESMKESQYLKVFLRYELEDKLQDESIESVYRYAKDLGLPVKEQPFAAISRGEAAVLLAKSFTKKEMSKEEAVAWLYDQGVINGYQDEKGNYQKSYQSFQPEKAMSRAHLVTILYRLDQSR